MASWNTVYEGQPTDSDNPQDGNEHFQEMKTNLSDRLGLEHLFNPSAGAATPGGEAGQGWHLEGSAKAYYESSAPTYRPAGVAPSQALDSSDAGRLWIDSDTAILYLWNGSDWVSISRYIVAHVDIPDVYEKIVDIGVWNMTTDNTVSVAHGERATSIRSVHALIRNDADATGSSLTRAMHPLETMFGTNHAPGGGLSIGNTNVVLSRTATEDIDADTGFDHSDWSAVASSYNRGWLVISSSGVQVAETDVGGHISFPHAVRISKITVRLETAPTGASFIIGVNKTLADDSATTDIFDTGQTPPTIVAGAKTNSVAAFHATDGILAAGDYLTIDIDQVGSTIPGSGLTLSIEATIR
jgi:hypothetical protein